MKKIVWKRFNSKKNKLKFSGRTLATDLCNYGITGWTEAIALDQFYDEPVYATICHGRNIWINSK